MPQAVNEVLNDVRETDSSATGAIMEEEIRRSRLYHTDELDALSMWDGARAQSMARAL